MEVKVENCDKGLQIENFLLSQIDSQQYQEGAKLPSENELSDLFGVNRHTVRKAIERLCKLGRIYAVQGKGCFVSPKPSRVIYPILSESCFSDNLDRRGRIHHSRLLHWELTAPSREEQKHLHLADGESIYRLEILRFVDNLPLSVCISAIPAKIVPGFTAHLADFHSLYGILRTKYEIFPRSKYRTIETTYPSLQDIDRLQITEHVSILEVKALAVKADGLAIEYLTSRIRGDRYKLKITFR